ncbi:putative ABC transport system ATP-binding protein [Pseudochelatococcus lubricantis]|uniref:ABC transport system ATP-binding protein n=1 Tax=Pseudochelatococcus lubricantis TaxID=1538102 RepID=A0ABX0UWP5_9HYPH|nr:ABC transporter ATP-binding protein [Pseudochelatococcus lubricantis]NIJ56699.1 putative ABC transport system ATP-binding protein [Pseudochelatococcus lubricantis]
MVALQLSDVRVSFPGLDAPVLDIPRLEIAPGENVVITGPSGSGKTTLINVITGLEKPDQGTVRWGDIDLVPLTESQRDAWRATHVGLVMQEFHLFPGLSAIENVLLPVRFRVFSVPAELRGRAAALLERVGLKRHDQRIETMSRGEMQRVAVARALLGKPAVLVADEPTASLDAASGAVVGDLLTELADEENATLIAVTHDPRLASRLQRRLRLVAGRIVEDTAQTAVPPTAASAATAQQGQVTS